MKDNIWVSSGPPEEGTSTYVALVDRFIRCTRVCVWDNQIEYTQTPCSRATLKTLDAMLPEMTESLTAF